MKHLLTLGFLIFFLFFYSHAQDIKIKSKGGKTKVKEAGNATDSNANNMGTSANTSGLTNTTWRGYIGDPLNDTLILRFATDSSYAQSKTGDAFVTSLYKVSHDTLVFNDVSGMYACPNQSGKYRFTLNGDSMTVVLIEDECQGRAAAINNTRWQKTKATASQ